MNNSQPETIDDSIVNEIPDLENNYTADGDASTVTDAWEGVFLKYSGGYNQTNVYLVQITEVSGSGKSVLVREVCTKRVDTDGYNEWVVPTDDYFSDEFRLFVREDYRGKPNFRGSMPIGEHSTTDVRSFRPYQKGEKGARQTVANMGH